MLEPKQHTLFEIWVHSFPKPFPMGSQVARVILLLVFVFQNGCESTPGDFIRLCYFSLLYSSVDF